ncbi:hypothetical protein [Microbacterium sp.]|uniref:hypothetical protein n=1 Tax=Microbacterium sp. TaxID=51671 RepID=UPI003C752F05
MKHLTNHLTRAALFATAAALALGSSACGSSPGAGSTPSDSAAPESAAACDELLTLSDGIFAVAFSEEPPDAASVESLKEQFETIATGTAGAAATAATDAAATLDEILATDNFALLQDPTFLPNLLGAGEAGRTECGYHPVDVTAEEHAAASASENPEFHFTGLPATLPAGKTNFLLDNPTDGFHDLAVYRLNDDYTGTLDEFIALDDAGMAEVAEVVTSTIAPPQASGYTNAELTEGRHIVLCHVPLFDGEGPDAMPVMGPNGPIWHYTLGMVEEVTVN